MRVVPWAMVLTIPSRKSAAGRRLGKRFIPAEGRCLVTDKPCPGGLTVSSNKVFSELAVGWGSSCQIPKPASFSGMRTAAQAEDLPKWPCSLSPSLYPSKVSPLLPVPPNPSSVLMLSLPLLLGDRDGDAWKKGRTSQSIRTQRQERNDMCISDTGHQVPSGTKDLMEPSRIKEEVTQTGLPSWTVPKMSHLMWTGGQGLWLHLGTLADLGWEEIDRGSHKEPTGSCRFLHWERGEKTALWRKAKVVRLAACWVSFTTFHSAFRVYFWDLLFLSELP